MGGRVILKILGTQNERNRFGDIKVMYVVSMPRDGFESSFHLGAACEVKVIDRIYKGRKNISILVLRSMCNYNKVFAQNHNSCFNVIF